jgi:hypothetical protein
MKKLMNPGRRGLLVTALLFPGILLFLEIGRRIGVRRRALEGGAAGPGSGALEAAEDGLLGLIRVDAIDHLLVDLRATMK